MPTCVPCAAKSQPVNQDLQPASVHTHPVGAIEQGLVKPSWSPYMSTYPAAITVPPELAKALGVDRTIVITGPHQFVKIAVIDWMRTDPQYRRFLI